MRKIDFTNELFNARGKPIMGDAEVERDKDGKPVLDQNGRAVVKQKALTLAEACIIALEQPAKNDDQLPVKKRVELGRLARRIADAEAGVLPIDISDDEAVTLKERIAKVFANNGVVTAAALLIEPDPEPEGRPQPAPKAAAA